MPVQPVNVSDIKIGRRHRTDDGDLTPLCESITGVGLLHPIGLNSRMELVYGGRRLAAVKRLGWPTVPANVLTTLDDATAALIAERDENTCRKEMTASEVYALGKELEALERPKAAERKEASQAKAGEKVGSKGGDQFTPPSAGKTRDKVGEALGMSGPQYQRVKAVVEQGAPELVKAVDAGDVSVSAAAELLTLPPDEQAEVVQRGHGAVKAKVREKRAEKQQKAEARPPEAPAPQQQPKTPPAEVDPAALKRSKAIETAYEVITLLLRIPKADPRRSEAFGIVTQWINHNNR
jgi:ParB-like chromosome segregation protein Spo0J